MFNRTLYYDTYKQKFYKQRLYIDIFLNGPYHVFGFFLNKKITIYKNLLIIFNSNSICMDCNKKSN